MAPNGAHIKNLIQGFVILFVFLLIGIFYPDIVLFLEEYSPLDRIIYALLGGVLPALIWLFFWLREDLHPEPKRLITRAFSAGIIAIPLALLAESVFYCLNSYLFLGGASTICRTDAPSFGAFMILSNPLNVIVFAAAEEYTKYKAAQKLVLRGKDFDEPVDAMIYMITAALGFAAFENFFFLMTAFTKGIFEGLLVSNLRFLGATLLHTISSGLIGYGIAMSFYAPEKRKLYVRWSIVAAAFLHALFNFTIIKESSANGAQNLSLFLLLLTGILLIFAFDRVKKIKQLTYEPCQKTEGPSLNG